MSFYTPLASTLIYQYLGSVTLDSTNQTGASTYHAYRFLPVEAITTDSSVVLDFSVDYNNWQYITAAVYKSCADCDLAPSRIGMYLSYTFLPYIAFNDYSLPAAGYNQLFEQLSPYKKGVVSTLLNWVWDKTQPVAADYEEMLDISQIGYSNVPEAFGECKQLTCAAQTELKEFMENLVNTLIGISLASEAFFNVHNSYEAQRITKCYNGVQYMPSIMSSISTMASALGENNQITNFRFESYLAPLNACAPIIYAVIRFVNQDIYYATAYSYGLEDAGIAPVSISDNGTITYAANAYPLNTLPGNWVFDDYRFTASRDTFLPGHTGVFKLNPAITGNYAFYLNNILKQEGEANQFMHGNFQNGDSLRVVLSEGGCMFADTLQLHVQNVCIPPESNCFATINGFFCEAVTGTPLNSDNPFNRDSSLVCGWVSWDGTPQLELTEDTLQGQNRAAVFRCSSHTQEVQEGILTAAYLPIRLEPEQKIQVSFFARYDTPFTDEPVKILCYAIDSAWTNNDVTDAAYPSVPVAEHALLLNDTNDCVPVADWTYYTFTCKMPMGKAYTRLAFLPRLPGNNQAPEKQARILITGLEIRGCCPESEVMISSDVYANTIGTFSAELGSFLQWQSDKPIINTGWNIGMPEESIQRIQFSGKLLVDEDLTIEHANIVFEEGSFIEILPGKKLTIRHAILQGCTQWKGIRVLNGGNIEIDPDVLIKDADWPNNQTYHFWSKQF